MSQDTPPLVLFDSQQYQAPSTDCNCACPSFDHLAPISGLLPNKILRRHPQLRIIRIAEDYCAAFVPSWSRIAVLDMEAEAILGEFAHHQPYEPDTSLRDTAIKNLYQAGLLIDADQDMAPSDTNATLSAWLHVTNMCNLRCSYCYITKSNEEMTPEIGIATVDMVLKSALRHGYKQILLKYAGGEASLNLPLVEHLHRHALQEAVRNNVLVTGVVLSNGVGLSRKKLELIRDLGLRLMISLDGPPETHNAQRPLLGGQGSHNIVVMAIEQAKQLGLDLTVSITITGLSVGGLVSVVSWLLTRKIHFSLNFYRACEPSESFQELKYEEQQIIDGMLDVYRQIEKDLPAYSLLGSLLDRTNLGLAHTRTCSVGESYMVVDHNGNVAKCQMEINNPVTTIWVDDPLTIIRLDLLGVQNHHVDEKEGCRDCEWRYWCAGGCALATFRATGRYDVKSPNCRVYQTLYPEVVRLEGLRLLRQFTDTPRSLS